MGEADSAIGAAIAMQEQWRGRVQPTNSFAPDELHTVAGIDAAYHGDARAAVVVMSFPALVMVEQATATLPTAFPYVPGLLSFREIPVVLAALAKLTTQPDIVICDGQGYAHPRRFGLACHLGVLIDKPTIGCAKTHFIGDYVEPGPNMGDCSPLIDDGETIGMVVRTRPATKPVFVSIGHKVDLDTAVAIVLRCVRGYRLPETTRAADHLSKNISPDEL